MGLSFSTFFFSLRPLFGRNLSSWRKDLFFFFPLVKGFPKFFPTFPSYSSLEYNTSRPCELPHPFKGSRSAPILSALFEIRPLLPSSSLNEGARSKLSFFSVFSPSYFSALRHGPLMKRPFLRFPARRRVRTKRLALRSRIPPVSPPLRCPADLYPLFLLRLFF